MRLFRTRQLDLPGAGLKHYVIFNDVLIAGFNDQTTAETLAIELNALVETYVESEMLAAPK